MTKRKIQYWVIPPESDSEFVAYMEDVLDIYALPYNPSIPVVCMDKQPVQLLNEKRASIPGTQNHAKRVDYEYERARTTCLFMLPEELAALSFTSVTVNAVACLRLPEPSERTS